MEATAPIELHPTGMSCAHCVRTVREALEGVDGVHVEAVEVGRAVVTVTDPHSGWTDVEPTVRAALEDAGHPLP